MTRPALDPFPPTLAAARARIAAVRPADYARSRNALDGAVTRLSPYITHGLVSLPEVLAGVAARHRLDVQHKLVFELGWRAYFHHVWQHRGAGILQSLHPGPLPEAAYAGELPADIRTGCTGVPVIDQAVRTLYTEGYLHNHARLWLASYVVHVRRVHWRAGADWLLGHLLDGDLASNHLSWQWVAGTGSHKPYLFNADNVARHAPPAWHSPGTVVDTAYEHLEALAHGRQPAVPAAAALAGAVAEPALHHRPPAGVAGVAGVAGAANMADPAQLAALAALAQQLTGRDVWLVHPWALGDPPAELPAHAVRLGWWPEEHHAAWGWSAARWAFVGQRMAALAPVSAVGHQAQLARLLAPARSVQTLADPHVGRHLPALVRQRPAPSLFPTVDRPCPSFSAWWHRSTRGLQHLTDLPGLAAWAAQAPAGPLFGGR